MIFKKITTKSLLYDYVEEVRSDFFSKNFLGSDFFGARKNGSDFLALLKKFENPWPSTNSIYLFLYLLIFEFAVSLYKTASHKVLEKYIMQLPQGIWQQ